jgi:glutaredoxin
MLKVFRILLIAVAVLSAAWPAATAADGPVVHVVLFWSQTCPHCHYVIEEVLPPLQVRYGPQLRLKMLESSQPGSAGVYQATVQMFNVPPERQGVPTLVIGDQLLVGSAEIPEQLPGLIERYLAKGGVGYPPLPNLDRAAATEICGAGACTDEVASAQPADAPGTTTAVEPVSVAAVAPVADPLANTMAGAMLLGLAAVLVYAPITVARAGRQVRDPRRASPPRPGRQRSSVEPWRA